MILARAADGQSDSCSGDSGGPLFIQEANGTWLLLGVVSWGRQCLDPILPGAYSRVKHAADWILQSIDPALYSHVTRFPLARWSSDTDDDGWPDLTEYAAGTLPDDSRSVPEVTLAPGNDGTWTASGSLRAHLNASWWRLETTRDWQTWEEVPPTVSGGNWQRTLPDHAATFLRVRAQLGDREGLARQTNALPR